MENTTSKSNKQNYLGIGILLVFIAGGAYYLGTSNKESASILFSQEVQNNTVPSGSIYDYTEASSHIGEYAGIKGRIFEVHTSQKGTVFFNYCQDYRSCPFSVVIFASDVPKFTDLSEYQDQTVAVTGRIQTYQGRAQIILNNPNQISY